LVEHRRPRGRSPRGDVARPDARGSTGGGRGGAPLPRAAAAAEPVGGGRGARAEHAAGRGMLRLADVAGPAGPAPLEWQVPVVAALEAEYRRTIAPHLRVGAGSDAPEDFLRWADRLSSLHGRLGGLAHWEPIESQVRRLVGQVVGALDGALGGALAEQWREWRDRYV